MLLTVTNMRIKHSGKMTTSAIFHYMTKCLKKFGFEFLPAAATY